MRTDYDKLKFKEFLVGQQLSELQDKSAVLLVAPMGAGKNAVFLKRLILLLMKI